MGAAVGFTLVMNRLMEDQTLLRASLIMFGAINFERVCQLLIDRRVRNRTR